MSSSRNSSLLVLTALLFFCIRTPLPAAPQLTTSTAVLRLNDPATTEAAFGLPAYQAATFELETTSGPRFHVAISAPEIVAVADKPEKWGYFQFPSIGRNRDGAIWVKWSMAPDSITAYGKGSHSLAVKAPGQEKWLPAGDDFTTDGGVLLHNGDRIAISTPPAIPVRELDLPNPVGSGQDNYAKKSMTLYRLGELPDALQGVYLERLRPESTEWRLEHDKLIDPKALRYSFLDLFPVVWWGDMAQLADGSIYAGIYPGFSNESGSDYTSQYGVFFYRSDDNGNSWRIQGRIPYQGNFAADPKAAQRMGYSEPGFIVLKDGSFLCVMRTSDGAGPGPMYSTRSTDLGKTWLTPKPITSNGVLPQLLQLESGIIALSSGRPGVQLRFATDKSGTIWTEPIELLPQSKSTNSCAYTDLLQTGPDKFLLVYSDFLHKTPDGQRRKAIKVREITVSGN